VQRVLAASEVRRRGKTRHHARRDIDRPYTIPKCECELDSASALLIDLNHADELA
jgi:hypothetical protein